MDEEGKLSYKELVILQKMLDFQNVKRFSASELADFIGTQSSNPLFYNVMKLLKQMGIISIIDTIGTIKFLRMDYKKLKILYWEQKEVQRSIDTFVNHYIASINFG